MDPWRGGNSVGSGREQQKESLLPFLNVKPSLAGILSLVFLAALGILMLHRNDECPVEAVTRSPVDHRKVSLPGRYYTVQYGDTLEQLARRFYHDPLEWQTLARVNDIRDPRKLQAGIVIWVPDPPGP